MPTILLLIALLAVVNVEGKAPCKQKLDLLFIFDGSSTVCDESDDPEACPNWEYNRQFFKDIVDSLTIGTCDSNIAAVTLSESVMVEWTLKAYTDKITLKSAIDSIKFPGGEFNNLASAAIITDYIFSATTEDRMDALKIMLLVTDGVPGIPTDEAEETSTDTHDAGIAEFVVCIAPGCTESLAKVLASKPKKPGQKTYFLVDNYSLLYSVKDEVLKNICAF